MASGGIPLNTSIASGRWQEGAHGRRALQTGGPAAVIEAARDGAREREHPAERHLNARGCAEK